MLENPDSYLPVTTTALSITTTPFISTDTDTEQLCGDYEQYTLPRFVFISLGSGVALFGIVANFLLAFVFLKPTSSELSSAVDEKQTPNPASFTPSTLYPRVLALLDATICAVYILLFGADAVVAYVKWRQLFILYHVYIVEAFVVARIAQLAIPYMLIFATLERYAWVEGGKIARHPMLKAMFSTRGRYTTVALSLVTCLALRLPTYWATTVYEFPACDDFFRSKMAGAAPWVFHSAAYHVYDFHLLSITQSMVPFAVLLVSNVIIVKRLVGTGMGAAAAQQVVQFNPRSASAHNKLSTVAAVSSRGKVSISLPGSPKNSISGLSIYQRRRRLSFFSTAVRMNQCVKSAVYTMVAIVASYLLSNSLHLVLTVLERSNSALLKHPDDPNLASTFHTVFSDCVSFVYMFTSAARCVIYYVCNPALRHDIQGFLCGGSSAKGSERSSGESVGGSFRRCRLPLGWLFARRKAKANTFIGIEGVRAGTGGNESNVATAL